MIRIRVDLGTSTSIPARIEGAEGKMLRGTAEIVARAIGEASGSSRIAAGTQVAGIAGDHALVVIGAGVPFARIRDRGGTIRPRRAQVLRFADGEFRPFARQRGNRYISRGAEQAAGQTGLAYHVAFGRL